MSLFACTAHSTPTTPLSTSFSTNSIAATANPSKRASSEAETEEVPPQAKRRVSKWVVEMGSRERQRIRSLSAKAAERELQINQELAAAEVDEDDEDADADGEDEDGNPIIAVPKIKAPQEKKLRLVYNSGELGRERAMLYSDASSQLEGGLLSGGSTPLLPSHSAFAPSTTNLLSASITKKIPSHAELSAMVMKSAVEHGLTGGLGASKGGANAGITGSEEIGKVLGMAVDEFVSNLTLKHLSGNRVNLSSAPSVSLPPTPLPTPPSMDDVPALSSSSSSTSSSASLKSLDPEEGSQASKKNRVWSMNEFQATAEMHPTVVSLRGSAIRRLSSGLYYDQVNPSTGGDDVDIRDVDFDENETFEADYSMLDESKMVEAGMTKDVVGVNDLPMVPLHPGIKNHLNHRYQTERDQEEEASGAAVTAVPGVKEKKKKGRKDDYDYIDPRSILDGLLG